MKKLYSLLILFLTSFSSFNAQCDYTINLVDSWGDSWNGNSIDVLINGTVVSPGLTVASGSSASFTFEVNTGDVITTVYNATGSYQSENSYSIVDVGGNTVVNKPLGGSGGPGNVVTADNVSANCPSCSPISNLAALNLTTTSAYVNWTGSSDATSYSVEYGPIGFVIGSGTNSIVSVSPTIADNPNSLFSAGATTWPHVLVATTVADGAVSQVAQNFTMNITSLPVGGATYRIYKTIANGTDITCCVGNLSLGEFSKTVAAVAWDRNVSFQFSSGDVEFDALSLNGDVVYPASSFSGLDPDTEYEVFVESNCGADVSSPVSSSFTTLPDPTCEYTINMVDSYGDGWNGASIDVLINGVAVASFSNPSSANGGEVYTETISAYTGDEVSFSWNSGSYDSEISFEIFDPEFTSLTAGYITAPPAGIFLTDASSLSICPTPNCPDADDLTASNITATSADLSWTTAYNSSSFNIEYGPAPYIQGGGGTILVVDVNETTIAAQTSLFVSGSNAPWVHIYPIVLTSDGVASQPEQTFSINVTSLPVGGASFRLIKQNAPGTGASFVPGGTNAINLAGQELVLGLNTLVAPEVTWNRYVKAQFNSDEVGFNTMSVNGVSVYAADQGVSISGLDPETEYDFHVQNDCDANGTSLEFSNSSFTTLPSPGTCGYFTLELYDSYGDGWNGGTMDVTINGSAFITSTIATGTGPEVSLIPVNIGDVVDFIYTVGSYGSENSYKVFDQNGDEIIHEGAGTLVPNSVSGVNACPSCLDPSALTASNVTSTTADLSWTAGDTETAWNFEYGPAGFTQSTGTSFNLTTNSYSLTGLTPINSYDVYVQADCGSGNLSEWVGPISVSTPGTCGFFTLELYDSYGDGWNGGTMDVTINGSAFITSTIATGTGPEVSLIPVNIGDVVDFIYTVGSYGSENSYKVFDQNGDEIIHEGAGTLVPNSVSGVNACPTCPGPSALTASNVTAGEADLSWTAGGTETAWNFEYGPLGFTQGTGTSSALSSPNIALTGLTTSTQYEVYVQADCGSGDESSWASSIFTTDCDALTTFPYTLNFDLGAPCWKLYGSWFIFNTDGIGGTPAYGVLNGTVHDDHLVSPSFLVTDNVSDRFSVNSNGFGFPEEYEILVSPSGGYQIADFTDTLSRETLEAVNAYQFNNVDLSIYEGQSIRVAIYATGSDNYNLFDDVTIDAYVSAPVVTNETACDSYTWSVDGNTYTSDTNITVLNPAVDLTDVDDIFNLNLVVNYSSSSTEIVAACDSLVWYGNTYFDDATATTTLQTSNGCDSVVTLNLTVSNSYEATETITVCDTLTWQGTTYNTTGNYDFTDTRVNGCDSTINLVLTVNYSSSLLTTTSSCNSFDWRGQTFNTSGIYVAPASTNFAGCPQIDSLDLTITTEANSDTVTACDSYTWNGNTYTSSGEYFNPLNSCVDTLFLTLNSSSSSSSTLAACDSTNWNGITYFTSGTYNVFTTNAAGCDSSATLNLTVGNTATNNISQSACDSYNWNGNTYTSSGVYNGVFQTNSGCDSIVNLTLTINSSSNQTVTLFSCNPYLWDGVVYSSSGDYTNVYTSSAGCDSSVTLILTVGNTQAPFSEGFDIDFPSCWTQPDSASNQDNLDWIRNSFATPSQGTGPTDDVIGGGHYMYIESSLPAQYSDQAIMYTSNIDISSLSSPELRFFSHMYGSAIGTLRVELIENDSVYTTIFTKSGDHGDLWIQERALFSSSSNIVRFKITGILDSNSVGGVWEGDIAIDQFGIREAVPNDLAIIAAAVKSNCELTSAEQIELWIVNNGLVDQANFDLTYSINGGAPVLDSIAQVLNIGDTLKHIFNATADMSADGIYNIDFACVLPIDADVTDNVFNFVAENYTNPADAVTMGDTICFVGDIGQISAVSDGWIYWYDSIVGGNIVGENDTLSVTPSATTSYFAEVSVYEGFDEDFESYTSGDFIAQTSSDWNSWSDPNGGADDDAEVTDFVSSGGTNSLYLSDDYDDDIVLPFGNTYSSGSFYFETDMYIETGAYFNFQENVVNGVNWAFDLYFSSDTINVEIDEVSVLKVGYSPNNPLGAPAWFNFSLEADLDAGQWRMSKDGIAIGSFSMDDEISSVNFWASTGNDYYIDNVEWGAWGGNACRSLSRTEAVVTLDSCITTSVSEVSFENLKIYPNPNNGSFTINNSELISSVVITDLQGKVVFRNNNLNIYNLNVNLENLDRGMYLINIISENEITTKSIILN